MITGHSSGRPLELELSWKNSNSKANFVSLVGVFLLSSSIYTLQFHIVYHPSNIPLIFFIICYFIFIYIMLQWYAKKDTVCKKNEHGENLFVKNFIFFVDKLNMINFNIFNMLKHTFTCESVAYLLQNNIVNVKFQLNSIIFACILL